MSHAQCNHPSTSEDRARCRASSSGWQGPRINTTAVSGIYVIEISIGVIKVGLSEDTDRRIATHIRNARGLGADPYRFEVVRCPEDLLRHAERAAHKVTRGLGGVVQSHTPEVFTGVYFNPVLLAVMRAVELTLEYEAALEALSSPVSVPNVAP